MYFIIDSQADIQQYTPDLKQKSVTIQVLKAIGIGAAVVGIVAAIVFAPKALHALAEPLPPEIASTFAQRRIYGHHVERGYDRPLLFGSRFPAVGRFLTNADSVAQILSPFSTSLALNLPEFATAETLNAFTIPTGTTIFTGGVAGRADTATQIFIQDQGSLPPTTPLRVAITHVSGYRELSGATGGL
jgi:hypothetical protein